MTGALGPLAPNPLLLALAVVVDLAVGDPEYAWHPIRLVGRLLTTIEGALRRIGLDGYGGGILLFVVLAFVSLVIPVGLVLVAFGISPLLSSLVHLFVLYSLLALGDLLHHVRRIDAAVRREDLAGARTGVAQLVGRDTDRMDGAACRRAAVESLSENLTDGFVSPLFWYALAGLPGIVLFKVVSTMDSMVGNKTPRYLRFGWCGARLDDGMNYVPARMTWIAIAIVAAALPSCSAGKAWRIGLQQHAWLLGPNSGWSEAAAAGALQRRLVGPIWLRSTMVTELWIGDPSDPPLASGDDVTRALRLTTATGVLMAAVAAITCALLG